MAASCPEHFVPGHCREERSDRKPSLAAGGRPGVQCRSPGGQPRIPVEGRLEAITLRLELLNELFALPIEKRATANRKVLNEAYDYPKPCSFSRGMRIDLNGSGDSAGIRDGRHRRTCADRPLAHSKRSARRAMIPKPCLRNTRYWELGAAVTNGLAGSRQSSKDSG